MNIEINLYPWQGYPERKPLTEKEMPELTIVGYTIDGKKYEQS